MSEKKHATPFDSEKLQFRIVGHPTGQLHFHPGPAKCGNIEDGITLWPGQEGPWVVTFKDLEAMYLYAKQVRTRGDKQP